MAAQTVKYGTAVGLIAVGLGGFPGVVPTLSAGFLTADRYARLSNNPSSLSQKILKYTIIALGILSVGLSESGKVIGSFLLSSALVFNWVRIRHNAKIDIRV